MHQGFHRSVGGEAAMTTVLSALGNYMLLAMDANGVPSIAKIVNVSQSPPRAQPPGAPTIAANAGDGAVSLSWTAPASDGGAAITGYKIERGTASRRRRY
jgi:hypothetical protein